MQPQAMVTAGLLSQGSLITSMLTSGLIVTSSSAVKPKQPGLVIVDAYDSVVTTGYEGKVQVC